MLGSGLTTGVGLRRRHCRGQICRDRGRDEPPPHSIARLDSRFILDREPQILPRNGKPKTGAGWSPALLSSGNPTIPSPCATPRAHSAWGPTTPEPSTTTTWPNSLVAASRPQRRRSRPATRDRPRKPATCPGPIDLLLTAVAHRGAGGVVGQGADERSEGRIAPLDMPRAFSEQVSGADHWARWTASGA